MTIVEELVSVLGLEIGEGALATLTKFRTAVTQGLAGVGGMVAALGAAFVGTVVSVAELGTEINTTALKIGIGTDALQEMKYAADISNVSFETLTTAMKFLSKNAAEGSDSAKRIFEAFSGIPMRDAQGNLKKVDVLLEDFADKIAATKDPVKQVELAMHALHGQSGVSLLPMLKLGKKGIQALREEAEDLGYVLDKKTIESSARFTVSLKHLKNALLGTRNTLGAPFIDDFSDALDWMTERVRAARTWFQGLTKDIRDLGQRFGRVVEVGKKAFEMVRKFITENKLDKLADTVHWVEMLEAALIGVAAIAIVSAASFAASWLLAAAPFIIIATLIGLIVDDIAHFLSGGDSVLGMADKWAKAFNPDDSNLIKFLKQATQLLFDLGDPAKWRRVVEAAKNLTFGWIGDLNGWGERPADNEAKSRAANPYFGNLWTSNGLNNASKCLKSSGTPGLRHNRRRHRLERLTALPNRSLFRNSCKLYGTRKMLWIKPRLTNCHSRPICELSGPSQTSLSIFMVCRTQATLDGFRHCKIFMTRRTVMPRAPLREAVSHGV